MRTLKIGREAIIWGGLSHPGARGGMAAVPGPIQWLQPLRQEGLSESTDKNQNVQDVFLNHIRKNKTPVTIFLVNGVKLQGIVTWFDNFSVLLRRDGHSQLVYKHAISTVMPAAPVMLFDGDKEIGEG